MEVSTALQEMWGGICKKSVENFCLEILIKIEFFAREIANDMDSFAGVGNQKKPVRLLKIFEIPLDCLRLPVRIYTGKRRVAKKAIIRMGEEFKRDYGKLLTWLENNGYQLICGEKILTDYYKTIKNKKQLTGRNPVDIRKVLRDAV